MKTLHNSTASEAKKNVKDIVFWGNRDTFKLISKASSESEGWTKSTRAMQIDGVGCVVQVTTQQLNDTGMHSYISPEETREVMNKNNGVYIETRENVKHSVVAEALTYILGVCIEETEEDGVVVSRRLVAITS